MPPCESATASHSGSSGTGDVRRGDQLAAQQDEADLRAVAVRHDHAPAVGDQLGDVPRRLAGVLGLLGDRAALAVEDQRVPADRDDRRVRSAIMPPPAIRRHAAAGGRGRAAPRRTPRAARCDARRRSARRPASRCAIPVLITGGDRRCRAPAGRRCRSGVPAKLSGGSGKCRVRRERDPAHRAGVGQRVGRRAADEADDRRARRPSRTRRCRSVSVIARVAEVRVGVVGAVAGEEQAVRHADRGGEPGSPVPATRIPNSTPLRAIAVTTRRVRDPVRGVHGAAWRRPSRG